MEYSKQSHAGPGHLWSHCSEVLLCQHMFYFIFYFIFIFWGGGGCLSFKKNNVQKQTYCSGQSLQKGMWTIPKNVLMSQSCQGNWYQQWAFWSLTCHDLVHYEWPIPIATVARPVDGLTAGLFGHSVTTCFMMTDSLTPMTFSVVNCL